MKHGTQVYLIAMACMVAFIASVPVHGQQVALNKALYDFEFYDAANTIVAVDGDPVSNSVFWTSTWTDLGSGLEPQIDNANGDAAGDAGESFSLKFPRDDRNDTTVTSIPFGPALEDGKLYRFTFMWKRFSTSSQANIRFRVISSITDTVLIDETVVANDNTVWTQTANMDFTGTGAVAGEQVYIVFSDGVGGARDASVDEITMEVIGEAVSDAARVLAFNVDAEKSDFEFVNTGVAIDLSLTASLDGASSGGSTDGSYGSFPDVLGTGTNTPAAYPWAANGANSLMADITITNTSSQVLKLDGLYFDLARSATTAVRRIALDYIGGDLGATGSVYDVVLQSGAATNGWSNYNLTLAAEGTTPADESLTFNALSDIRLGTNETAIFRLTLETSTDAASEPDLATIDNVALIGDFIEDNVLVDWGNPDMFYADQGNVDLRTQNATVVTNGSLIINNFIPTKPTLDNSLGNGYYQDQPLWAIYQSGNEGPLAESTDYRFLRLTAGSTSSGSMIMTVEPTTNAAYQSSLVYVKSSDFYDEIGAGEIITSLSLNVDDISSGLAEIRFAVLDSGQWYVSATKATALGTFSQAFPYAENAWAAFAPATLGSTSMMTASGLVFDTAGSAFTNVEAVGYFVEGYDPADDSKVTARVDDFRVESGIAPGLPSGSVLAFNVDDNANDFEYIKSGLDLSLNVIETRGSGTTEGSLDGSFGSFFDPIGADTNNAYYPWHARGNGDQLHTVEMTISNTLADSKLDLDGFYFDALRLNSNALRRIELEYIGGDLSGVASGLVYGVTFDVGDLLLTWSDFDWTFASEGSTPTGTVTFSAMADTTLDFGESATFRFKLLAATSNAGEPGQLRVDNVAFIGSQELAGYSVWIAGFGLNPADQDPTDDPDGDGVSNLEEYARNGNPNDNGDTGTASSFEPGAGDVMNYVYPKRSDDDSLLYHIEVNNDLVFGTWTNAGYTVTGTDVTGGTLNFVTNELSTAVEDEQFVRLIIEQQ